MPWCAPFLLLRALQALLSLPLLILLLRRLGARWTRMGRRIWRPQDVFSTLLLGGALMAPPSRTPCLPPTVSSPAESLRCPSPPRPPSTRRRWGTTLLWPPRRPLRWQCVTPSLLRWQRAPVRLQRPVCTEMTSLHLLRLPLVPHHPRARAATSRPLGRVPVLYAVPRTWQCVLQSMALATTSMTPPRVPRSEQSCLQTGTSLRTRLSRPRSHPSVTHCRVARRSACTGTCRLPGSQSLRTLA